ncbi:transglutaminase domain-containing protein [Paenibacillus humicola]|uniref:transglutaminase domain-containing protein n=1 Tax=Paenibacillus humicola TaxID=3110540 RepID=UPI00237BA1C3|nr:transglutaminase domain-containing protein [Paenibacillus humicola]
MGAGLIRLLTKLALIGIIFAWIFGFEFKPVKAMAGDLALQALGSDLVSQLLAQRETIEVRYSGNKKELSSHFAALLRDAVSSNDYIAYIVDSYMYTVRTWGTAADIKVRVTYRESAVQTQEVDSRVGLLLKQIVKPGMSQADTVKAIHDWIVLHTAYDVTLKRYTAYDALTSGTAVCQGYALLAYRMLQQAGIESRIVEGSVDSGSHVWNLVHIGRQWYHMDVTWDDPVPDRKGNVSHAYFLRNDAEMRRDHTWSKPYPAASGLPEPTI